MNQCRLTLVDQALKMLECSVEVSGYCGLQSELEFRTIIGALRDTTQVRIRQGGTPQLIHALEIAQLPVRAHEQFTSDMMFWIAIERLVGKDDHVVVPTLIPARDCDL